MPEPSEGGAPPPGSGSSPNNADAASFNASTPSSAQTTSGSTNGAAIVAEAKKYIGHPYRWGGGSNPTTGWDCSSFVNYVLHQVGLDIPGGWASTDGGEAHGPVVSSYVSWSGATTIPNKQAAPGDLVIYVGVHIGIATSNTEFISAEDPAQGTGIAPMSAGPGPYIIRRVKGVASSNNGSSSGDGVLSDIENSLGDLPADLIKGFLSALGVGSVNDLLERAAIILVGVVLLLVGIWKLAGPDAKNAVKDAAGTAAVVAK
jgi:hypothetical protein